MTAITLNQSFNLAVLSHRSHRYAFRTRLNRLILWVHSCLQVVKVLAIQPGTNSDDMTKLVALENKTTLLESEIPKQYCSIFFLPLKIYIYKLDQLHFVRHVNLLIGPQGLAQSILFFAILILSNYSHKSLVIYKSHLSTLPTLLYICY